VPAAEPSRHVSPRSALTAAATCTPIRSTGSTRPPPPAATVAACWRPKGRPQADG
jgi:hypothetical protein